jgi:hypothetical protein
MISSSDSGNTKKSSYSQAISSISEKAFKVLFSTVFEGDTSSYLWR